MVISDSGTIAKRKELILGLQHSLVFSSTPLTYNEPFEVIILLLEIKYLYYIFIYCLSFLSQVKLLNYVSHLAGSIKIGITDLNIDSESVRNNIPGLIKDITGDVWYASGNC